MSVEQNLEEVSKQSSSLLEKVGETSESGDADLSHLRKRHKHWSFFYWIAGHGALTREIRERDSRKGNLVVFGLREGDEDAIDGVLKEFKISKPTSVPRRLGAVGLRLTETHLDASISITQILDENDKLIYRKDLNIQVGGFDCCQFRH